jgi:hypothetical protein
VLQDTLVNLNSIIYAASRQCKHNHKQKVNILMERGWEIKLMRKLRLTAAVRSGVVCVYVTLAPYILQTYLQFLVASTDGQTDLHVAIFTLHRAVHVVLKLGSFILKCWTIFHPNTETRSCNWREISEQCLLESSYLLCCSTAKRR